MLGKAPVHRWDLTAEAIALKIRWFGLVVGLVLANWPSRLPRDTAALHAILAVGLLYTLLESLSWRRGRIFLGRHPLVCSFLEAGYIFALCTFDIGASSPFRYYFLLSLVLAAVRHPLWVPYVTCALHGGSFGLLLLLENRGAAVPFESLLFLVIMVWVTWSATALALLLKRAGSEMRELNQQLQAHQAHLERRIADRTRELEEVQAQVVHQERLAALGSLSAGIAHEVGNPLAAISGLVQTLRKQDLAPPVALKLQLLGEQVQRIQTTLRELLDFSRPTAADRSAVLFGDVVREALQLAKYCTRQGARQIQVEIEPDLPALWAARPALVQASLNLILNALDASGADGRILVVARQAEEGGVELLVADDGPAVPGHLESRLFQPHLTTKAHGTGLGLFITRKLIADQGGETTYLAQGPPAVAHLKTFRIHLPRALVHGQSSETRRSRERQVPAAAGADSGRR
ncbi:MAG TPA: histidine kinase dimerization/phospho-acceptor domain-containing protein [Gemmatales bacterium]|nr:histidine kinase dimerization/phospho-acceptor domain-containing protein [Gemmatales bacterium]